jgi:xylulokinase
VLFAGLDVSTQSAKLVVIDSTVGAVVHVDRVDYDRDLPHYETRDGAAQGLGEGVSESDPRMWIEAVEVLLGRAPAYRGTGVPAHRIRCISVSGQQHGLVALAQDGSLARPRAKLWNDFSTAEECRILTDAVGGLDAMVREVGNSQRTGYTAGKILHLKRHEPEHWTRTRILFLVHNYVNWFLTGGADGGVAALTARSAAEGAYLNVRINLPGIADEHFRKETLAEAEMLRDQVVRHTEETVKLAEKTMGAAT